jgi:DNA-binding GntR family transcriptional regulator
MIPLASLREQIYTYLRNEIQQGKLEPGSSLNIDKMSRELGISKTPLKEAMIRLECEGFVTLVPRRGVQVRELSLQELKNYYEIIGYLESGVVCAVFNQLRKAARVKRMKQSNAEQERALKKKDYDRYYHLNLEFHDIFLSLSGNQTLHAMVVPLKKRLYDFPRQSYWPEWEMVNLEEHRKFIASVEKGDREKAAAVIRDEHWGWQKHEPYFMKFYDFDMRSMKNKP